MAQFVTQDQVETLAKLKGAGAELTMARTRIDREAAEASKLRSEHNLIGVGFLVVVIIVLLYARVLALQKKHALQYAWYNGKKGVGPKGGDGRYGAKRGPPGQGDISFSMNCICIRSEYPALFQTMSFLDWCPALSEASAQFLLLMVQHFQNKLFGVHWDGDARQLKHASLSTFLESYAQWTSPANPWNFLFANEAAFTLSVAVVDAKRELPGSYLDSLFRGGLCALAVQQAKPDDSATDMALKLLGEEIVLYRNCEAERLQAAMKAGSTALTVGTAAHSVGGLAWYGAKKRLVKRAISRTIARQVAKRSIMTTASEGGAAAIGGEGVADVTVAAAVSWIPIVGWILFGVSVATMAVTVAVVSTSTYNHHKCQGGDFYVRVRHPSGEITESKWVGNPDELPGARQRVSEDGTLVDGKARL